jgi:hypothetical protein
MAVLEEEMSEEQTPCVPAVMKVAQRGKQVGDLCSATRGIKQARAELIRREGPPRGDRKYCCHTCPNDSTAPAGFVCTLHTRWGSAHDNIMDQDPEVRRQRSRIGGRAAGRISGRIVCARSDNPNKVQVTCPYCEKTGQKWAMSRWHFDNCKHKSPQLSSVTQFAAHVGMASASPSHVVTQHTV